MRALLALALIVSAPAAASSPAAWAASERAAVASCLRASGLNKAAAVGTPLVFDDSTRKTAVLVEGRWRPAHMKGARATMLCLYDRARRTATITEAAGWRIR